VETSDFVIAGLRYRLGDVDPTTRAELDARLPEFIAEPGGQADVTLSVEHTGDEPPNPPLFDQDVQIARESAGRIAAHRFDFDGTWDPARGEARCRYMGAISSLSSFLRFVSSFALLERRGVLLHASSVASHGRGFTFAGPSGAGKTTLARLAAPRPVLSDEVTALRWESDGTLRCFPTPFWGDMERKRAGPSAPLVAIGFPHHVGRTASPSLRPATAAEAFSRLLECVIAFDLTSGEKAGLLDVTAAIVRAVPCLHVEYSLDSSPWDLLDAFNAPP
jgi:hypothetical protein